MNRQIIVLALLVCNLALFVSYSEAGIFGRRFNSSNRNYTSRPTTTYRPVTQSTVQTARPAAVAAAQPAATTPQPAADSAVKPATVQPNDKSEVVQASLSKPQQPTFPSTILNMLARNNAIRTSRGMRPMILSSRLTAAAQNHANYMARTGGFSHYTNGGPQGRAATHGFRGGVRENIAMGQPSVDSAFAVWTASGGHYANMMSHTDVAGFGYAVGSNGRPYWVAVYGNNDGGN